MAERHIYLKSEEAFNLFALAIKVDMTIRRLSSFTLRGEFRQKYYFKILNKTLDAINAYEAFIDSLFTKFEDGSASKDKTVMTPSHYKEVMNKLKSYGELKIAEISTEAGRKLFNLSESTDVIIKIIDFYSSKNIHTFETSVSVISQLTESIAILISSLNESLLDRNDVKELANKKPTRPIPKRPTLNNQTSLQKQNTNRIQK